MSDTPRTDKRCLESQSLKSMSMRFAWMCDFARDLERENDALRAAVLFIPKMRWKEDVFNPFHPDVVDEKAAANVIVRRAIEIAGKVKE